ncbi:MAG: EF-hand domain-containing protein [Armatimonadota bacterium]|jgi:Ca2+-binding EF-hand superfamily protein
MRTKTMLIGVAVMALMVGGLAVGLTSVAAKDCCDDECSPTAANWEAFIEAHDADGSGTISREEFTGSAQAFSRIDADGDGQITREEAVAAEETKHQRQGQQGRLQAHADPAERWQKLIEEHDRDGDGRISQEEFGGPDHAFTRLDTDGDGYLTEAEVLEAGPRQRRAEDGQQRGQVDPQARWQRMIEQWDADGDGQISREEFRGQDHAFDRLDADGDGFLTEDEALAAGPRQQRAEDGQQRGQVDPQARWQRMIEQWDADGDGQISREEFRGQDHAFDRLDANDDGFLTEDEVLAARAGMGQGQRRGGNQQQ